MAKTFAKLSNTILDSTIWREDAETKVVWITLLAMADWDGYVGAALPGIADRARVSVEKTREAMDKFLSPDIESRSQEHEGRRIEKTHRGWSIINWAEHRDAYDAESRRAYFRAAQATRRAKLSQNVKDTVLPVGHSSHTQTETQTKTETETETEKKTPELSAGEVGSAGWIRDNFDRLYSAQSNTVARRRRAHDEMGPVRTWSEENVAPLDAKARSAFEGEFTRAAKAFFADTEPFVVKFRANLPYFLKNFDKYAATGAPKKSNADRPKGYFTDPSTLR